MRIRWSIRIVLVIVAVIAVVCAIQTRVSENARRFCIGVEAKKESTIESLLTDASVPSDRKFIGSLTFDQPHAIVDRVTLLDLIFFRRTCDVEFTSCEQNGGTFTSYTHNHEYVFNVFGTTLKNANESWKMTVH